MINRRLGSPVRDGRLQLPRVAPLAVHEPRVVVALVEELEDGRKNLRLLVRQRDASGVAVGDILVEGRLEEGGEAEGGFVGGEEAVFFSDDEGYDGGGGVAVGLDVRKLDWW